MSNAHPYADLNLQLFETAEQEFKYHLQAEHNSRIIFSGKFGHGKTTFLKWFFDQDEQKDKYNIIRLYPVNYSVASNEDVFEYIKYDIITEMLHNEYEVSDLGTDYFDSLPFFIKKNPLKVIALLVSMIPQVGKDVSDVMGKVDGLITEFKAYHDEHAKAVSEGNQLIGLLEGLEEKVGSIYESNAITKLIELVLKRQKEKDSKQETILIIDDLDRIDPEHIFRILNVFAAHFDLHSGENKFGFDKVMVVCDIENIRNIFKAKYGVDTDFNGYIDKFYSHKVFAYNLVEAFVDFAMDIIDKAAWLLDEIDDVDREDYIRSAKETLFSNSSFLRDMLFILIDSRQIDLRNVVKWNTHKISYGKHVFIEDVELTTGQFANVFFLRVLSDFKGSVNGLIDAIRNISEVRFNNSSYNVYSKQLALLYTIREHRNDFESGHFNIYLGIGREKLVLRSNEFKAPFLALHGQGTNVEVVLTFSEFKRLLIAVIEMLNNYKFL